MVLAHRANHESGKCFPSISRLVKDTGLSRRAIQNAISDLIRDEHITRFQDEGKCAIYFVHPKVSTKCTGESPAPAGGTSCTEGVQLVRRTGAPAAPKPEPTIIKKSTDHRDEEAALEILRLIGWARTLTNMHRVQSKLRDWLAEGYDLEADIVAGVVHAVRERPGRTSSLKRFDTPIKQHRALRSKGDNNSRPFRREDAAKSIGTSVAKLVKGMQIT
jgi:hypothetical protein